MLAKGLILLWSLAVTVVLGLLMARHYLPFAQPDRLNALGMAVQETYFADAQGLVGVHVLDSRCACSNEVISYLIEATAEASWSEELSHVVVSLGELATELQEQLGGQGIQVKGMPAEKAKELFAIETVPWFLIVDGAGSVLYAGGYSIGRIRDKMDVQIAEVLEKLRRHEEVPPMPVYGCATSQELRRRLLQFD